MKILALDTSGPRQSVAVVEAGRVLAEVVREQPTGHTVTLLASVQQALTQSALRLEDMDLYAVTHGPGSFTGLRIALSTVKAFAAVHPKPVAPVSSLHALASPHLQEGEVVVPCLDARMEEIYATALLREAASAGVRSLIPAKPWSLRELLGEISGISGRKLVLGSGVAAYPELLEDLAEAYTLAKPEAHGILASEVAKLGEAIMIQGRALSGKSLKAAYLRVSAAEMRSRP